MRHLEQNKSTLAFRRDDFGAGGEVRRGQAPPGSGNSGSDSALSLTRPAPGGVRRMFFDEKWCLGRPRVDLLFHFGCFSLVRKILVFFVAFLGRQKIEKTICDRIKVVPGTPE